MTPQVCFTRRYSQLSARAKTFACAAWRAKTWLVHCLLSLYAPPVLWVQFSSRLLRTVNATRRYGFPPSDVFTPDRWLNHGDTVTVGGEVLEVLHCPGHTPGHVVFFHRGVRVAWVGDVLFAGSIGRSDFPRGDHGTLIRSIRERLFPLGEDVTFVPGHGPTSTFGQERQTNPYVADRLFT